jgi:hypothetical protein
LLLLRLNNNYKDYQMTSSFDGNISIAPITHLAPVGSNPKNTVTKVAAEPLVRKLPGMTQYNQENGLVEEVGDFQDNTPGKPKPAAPKKPKPAAQKPKEGEGSQEDKTSRHQAWKAAQEAKKEQGAQAKAAQKAKSQALAADYLRQGNVHKASEALGLSVPEFITLTQNAALGIAQEPKKLSPEEQKAKDEADYRASRDTRLQELERRDYFNTAHNYIRENIDPVFTAEKYPLLTQQKENLANVKMGVYEYLNKHFVDTMKKDESGKIIPNSGEVLSVEDILDTLEGQYEDAVKSTLEKAKGIKKFETYFAKQVREAAEEEQEEEEPTEEEPLPEEEPEEEEEELNAAPNTSSVKPQLFGASKQKIPFALMSTADKLAELKKQRAKKTI